MYSPFANYCSGSCYGESPLENIVAQYAVAPSQKPFYLTTATYGSYAAVADTQPSFFLNASHPNTPFVGDAAEITEHIRWAFLLTAGAELPLGISITVSPREQLLQKSLAFLSDSVVGISIHSTGEIFVAAGGMADVMLTIGHELGHVIREHARTPRQEEAKAFAFEAAWAKAIFENDVAGLRDSINAASLSPARNGLHDVAFSFVRNNSAQPLQLFDRISSNEVSAEQILEGMQLQPTADKLHIYSLPRRNKTKMYGGYLNKSRVQNLPPPHNFFWSDLGKGVYGMYIPLTTVELINETLLRKDLEQLHKTLGHEYSLHHVMRLPDGYAVEALEEAMFWTADDEERYKPAKS